ncbi:MAG: Rrf2 family transcriptional regulator [Bacteroidetes bacterium]|nr:Rrf2 family transcriptional regulator [Bacteroidota bacterium]
MKVSTRLLYGTRLMVQLALSFEQGPIFLHTIAEIEGISEKYLSQIVILLKNAGLVRSFRGSQGGYILIKPADKITLYDVFNVFEESIALPDQESLNISRIDKSSELAVQDVFLELNDILKNKLMSITLYDLVKNYKLKNAYSLIYNI